MVESGPANKQTSPPRWLEVTKPPTDGRIVHLELGVTSRSTLKEFKNGLGEEKQALLDGKNVALRAVSTYGVRWINRNEAGELSDVTPQPEKELWKPLKVLVEFPRPTSEPESGL